MASQGPRVVTVISGGYCLGSHLSDRFARQEAAKTWVTNGFNEIFMVFYGEIMGYKWDIIHQWIGLRDNLQETPLFHRKKHGFLGIFP